MSSDAINLPTTEIGGCPICHTRWKVLGRGGSIYQFIWPVTPVLESCHSHVVCSRCFWARDTCVYCNVELVPFILSVPCRNATLKDVQDARSHPLGKAETRMKTAGT